LGKARFGVTIGGILSKSFCKSCCSLVKVVAREGVIGLLVKGRQWWLFNVSWFYCNPRVSW
jgi:hypothetical protein